MRELTCPYRFDIRSEGASEVATCGLLQRITEITSGDFCDVDRSACEACAAALGSSFARMNPVLPSLLYGACDRLIHEGKMDGDGRLQQLLEWAEQNLARAEQPRAVGVSCDVVLLCKGSASEVARAAESILAQQDAHFVLHLVLDGECNQDVAEKHRLLPNVHIHRLVSPADVFAALHELVPQLCTPYVAVQDAQSISNPFRLSRSVALLEEMGGEILAAPVETPAGIVPSKLPGTEYDRYFQPDTLVIRRATLADMGGFAERSHDADAEFVFRAVAEGRRLVLVDVPLVERCSSASPEKVGAKPTYSFGERCLREFARGYSWQRVQVDVVLPFYGRLDYADAALRSLVEQEQAEVVVHLIDDATPEDSTSFLNYWKSHPAVRLYRNDVNLGPFASFNNVVPHFETNLAAVQDADDISLPERLLVAGNLMRLADADIFGSRTRVFHDESPSSKAGSARYLWSQYPFLACSYFLVNPTAVIRKSAFCQLGGYGDFGERRRNRTGVDTEFFARAYYAGCRFSISRDVTVLYREHAESASRHPLTGFRSMAHRESAAERDRRIRMFVQGGFDARSFGALRQSRGATTRLR